MANQTASNVRVALKAETTTGVAPATVTGAAELRIIDSAGMVLDRAVILSGEKRSDGNVPMGRIGGKSPSGSFNCEVTVGGAIDLLIEAVMRSTWVASFSVDNTDMTSITTTSNTIVAAGGSWITEGFRAGQVCRLSNFQDAADNDRNFVLTGVTASTLSISTPVALVSNASADPSFTLTVLKNVVNATTPTRRSFSIEQLDQDLDDGSGLSELFIGSRCVGARLSFRPGSMATIAFSFTGMDRTTLDASTSPFYDSPSITTGLSLVADDSAILHNGSVVANFTGFDVDFQITASGVPVIGSLTTPDVFDNDLSVSGSVSSIRQDFSNIILYDAETEFAVGIKLEDTSSPPECINIYLPRVKVSNLSAPALGSDGAKIETLTLMAGPAIPTTDTPETVASISSSGA